jgi:cell wall-associated NlpC family hydrolase
VNVTEYVGLPYREGARGPDAWDCWGLVRHVLAAEFHVELPAYDYGPTALERQQLIRSLRPQFREVEPVPGAIALCSVAGRPHVGVCVDGEHILHAREGTGSVLERIDSRWMRNAVRGFYLPYPRA